MNEIKIQLPQQLALALAVSRGWTPTIDDETQEMVEDNYPQIPNPVSHIQYLESYIPGFIQEYVLNEGRAQVVAQFDSIGESIKSQVSNGTFDAMILQGDIEGIKAAVKSTL